MNQRPERGDLHLPHKLAEQPDEVSEAWEITESDDFPPGASAAADSPEMNPDEPGSDETPATLSPGTSPALTASARGEPGDPAASRFLE